MIELSKLPKITLRAKKRRGRGRGAGKGGHTVGRGQKGQKSRSKITLAFEGTKTKKSLLKRLPLLRGKGKFKPQRAKPIIVNLKYLNLLPSGSLVDIKALIEQKIVEQEARICGVKILGEGEITRPLTIQLPISKGAKIKIEKAGGKVLNQSEAPVKKNKLPRKNSSKIKS